MIKRNLKFLLVLLVVCTVSGCASFAKNSYTGLKSSAITYDMVMTAAGDLYERGDLSNSQKDEIIKLGTLYQTAHNQYLNAFKNWVKAGRPEGAKGALVGLQGVQLEKFSVFVDYARDVGVI